MTVRFQWARADGTPSWHQGTETFEPIWEHTYDLLRFHKGKRFTVDNVENDANPREMPLREVKDFLEGKLTHSALDTKFVVKSNADGYAIAYRRRDVTDPAVKQLMEFLLAERGEPYVLGAAGPSAYDCSGLTLAGVRLTTGILLPHKAGSSSIPSQLHDARIVHIDKAKLKPLDLLFHWGNQSECDHVSFYLDDDGPGGNGRVLDTEPHSTKAPAGWPTSETGVGVRIRPMNPGYYTDWAHVVAIGRIVQINGQP